MKIKQSKGEKIFDICNVVFMFLLVFITIYPLYYVVMASFSDAKMIMRHEGPIWWLLGDLNFEGYKIALNDPNIITGFLNTVWYLVIGTVLNMSATILAAFVLTRKHFVIRGAMMKFMIVTMFFSGGLIPLFFVVTGTGVFDTRLAPILPYLISTYNVIIMRTFFASLPASLEESAIIDGANDFHVLTRVVLPLSLPVLAVITLYYAVGHWNSWFPSLMFQRNREIFSLQMFLRETLIANATIVGGDNAQDLMESSYNKELV